MSWFSRWRRPGPLPHGRGSVSAADTATLRTYFNDAAANEEHYPASIDPRILFVKRLLDHLGDATTIADIGSGKGRFARLVKDRNPSARVIALDIAEAMLRQVPSDIAGVAALMTKLPLAAGSADGAYAIESLEHAGDIEAAVAELARILKPGGRLVIIDKNVAHWGRFETPPWERWFDQQEMDRLLRRHCSSVVSGPISYWEDVPADGLFLIWCAIK